MSDFDYLVRKIINTYRAASREGREGAEDEDVLDGKCICLNPDPSCVLFKRAQKGKELKRIQKIAGEEERHLGHCYGTPCNGCDEKVDVPYWLGQEMVLSYPFNYCGANDLACRQKMLRKAAKAKKQQEKEAVARDPKTKTDEELIALFFEDAPNCLACASHWHVGRELEKRGYMARATFKVVKVTDAVPVVCGDTCEFHTPEAGFECPDACPHQENNKPPEGPTSDTSEAPE